jgi:hypothetical protein
MRVQCGVTIAARHGTSGLDNSWPAMKPKLTGDLDADGSPRSKAPYLKRMDFQIKIIEDVKIREE